MYVFLDEGHLLDDAVFEVESYLFTYNSDHQKWSVVTLKWSRPTGGEWEVAAEVQILYTRDWRITDWDSAVWAMLHAMWVLVSIWVFLDTIGQLRPALLKKMHKTQHLRAALRLHLLSIERTLALLGAIMQLVVVALFASYHIQAGSLSVEDEYDISHNLYWGANFFFPTRKGDNVQGGADGNDTLSSHAASDGGLGVVEPAWALPEDNSGLDGYMQTWYKLSSLSQLYSIVFLLQALRTFIMISRVLVALDKQQRLGIYIKSLRYAAHTAIASHALLHYER
eukprot:gene2636-3401_t